jgi:hypothetical protein
MRGPGYKTGGESWSTAGLFAHTQLSYSQPLRIAVSKKQWRGKVRTRKGEVLYGVVGAKVWGALLLGMKTPKWRPGVAGVHALPPGASTSRRITQEGQVLRETVKDGGHNLA